MLRPLHLRRVAPKGDLTIRCPRLAILITGAVAQYADEEEM
jgi:hypothetical protein